jgi:LacI family transcriptional regulator
MGADPESSQCVLHCVPKRSYSARENLQEGVTSTMTKNAKGGRLKKRLTIYDVARITGFSRGSISRAFTNSPYIKAETREKILRAAREIGYQPHPGARLIKAERTKRWGILLPDFTNPYYAKLFEAFDIEAQRHETFLQLGLFHYNPKITDTLATFWSSGEVDGLVVDCGAPDGTKFARTKELGVPVIFLHGRPTEDFDWLAFDRSTAASNALQSLQALGHRRIAYVGMIAPHSNIASPYVLWQEWCAKMGIKDLSGLHVFVPNSSDGGEHAWSELRSRGERFTAVIAYNDIIACGLIQAARQDGIQIPHDLSVVGSDDIDEGRRLGLTTLRHDLLRAAMLCLRQLENRRQGDDRPPVALTVESEYVMRRSVGPAPRS